MSNPLKRVIDLQTKIFAHRGASMYAPENTMPALELAVELGAEGVEIDIRLTKDQVPVLIHDDSVDRTTDGTGFVRDYTLEEIQALDAGSWFSEKFAGTTIITLEDFLEWAKTNDLLLNIEFKIDPKNKKDFEQKVFDLVKKHDLLERTIISTFSVSSLQKMKELDLPFNRALLTSKDEGDLIDRVRELNLEGLHISHGILTEELMDEARKNDIEVRVYTVNESEDMKRVYAEQCDGIISDVPDQALEVRQQL